MSFIIRGGSGERCDKWDRKNSFMVRQPENLGTFSLAPSLTHLWRCFWTTRHTHCCFFCLVLKYFGSKFAVLIIFFWDSQKSLKPETGGHWKFADSAYDHCSDFVKTFKMELRRYYGHYNFGRSGFKKLEFRFHYRNLSSEHQVRS